MSPLLWTSPLPAVLLDIPASIAAPPGRRLRSSPPPHSPFLLPEPKNPATVFSADLETTHLRLRESLLQALQDVRDSHTGPYCHPRGESDDALPPGELDFRSNLSLLGSWAPTEPPEPLVLPPDSVFSDISDIYLIPAICPPAWSTLTLSYPSPAKTFYLPPNSSFLLSTFQSSIPTFTMLRQNQDFILLDPPWPNRSVSRSKSYSTLNSFDIKDLLLLPLKQVLADAGIVAVWITNKASVRRFVLEKLFPSWGVEEAGEWVWLKTTVSGDPIFNLEGKMRKPYETLLFGRKIQEEHPSEKPESVTKPITTIPRKIILAVPDLHSRKPCIKQLIEPFLPSPYQATEIFGRNLTEGWFTWGDEAIKWNWEGHWTEG